MQNLIRVRIWPFDFDGTPSNLDFVTYVESLEEAQSLGWKYELA